MSENEASNPALAPASPGRGGAEDAPRAHSDVRDQAPGGANEGMGRPGERRIGVYVCHCGGNISDYVDVERVVAAVKGEPGVVVARTTMFACSDASQQEMERDIEEQHLDGLVVASCSPKLHVVTFRGVAKRAGLNPYEYNQANIREQCSWTHTDDPEGATRKAIALVRGVIARTKLTEPLEALVVDTTQKALVIGGGITGLRAAIGLADIGLGVFLVERAAELGGWVGNLGSMYPHERNGGELIAKLVDDIKKRPAIKVFTGAEVVSKAGSFGNHEVGIRVSADPPETISVVVGSIVVATGFDEYQPSEGEFGTGLDGVVTLPEFKALIDASAGSGLRYHDKPVRSIAYVYCVGSRQPGGNEYCSRYCCTATAHASIKVAGLDPKIRQYHLYRDIRTYGFFELLYTEARKEGAVYVKYPDDAPPVIAREKSGGLAVTVRDLLLGDEELEIPVDLVVLVTGMVPRRNEELVGILKLPIGRDGFFNEIHPKLRPVETVVDGVLIAGTCQGPKNSAESLASGLAAVTQSASVLKVGVAELDPLVATVDPDMCTWCGKCVPACPYDAIEQLSLNGREVATISEAGCKGCGGCVPVCPENAIDLRGYTDAQITAMIDGLLIEAAV
ncbi:MAG TPA: CoB--CoM heterodisulfide reductase iron-sulfur subunit A family protein [Candidatus Limnocylindrales bacterium]